MSTPAAPAASSTDQQPLSEAARIINTFTAPTKTFNDIRRSARWFGPWLVMAICSVILVAVAAQKVGFTQLYMNRLHMSQKQADRVESLPADQRARAIDIGTTITKVISWGYPVFLLIFIIIIAAIMLATLNFGFGKEVTFNQSLAVVMYASLPGILKALLGAISLYAGASPEGFVLDNPVASNLGAVIDPLGHPALHVFGVFIDLFAIWSLVLAGIGFACVAKLKQSTSLTLVFGWYGILLLLNTGIAVVFA